MTALREYCVCFSNGSNNFQNGDTVIFSVLGGEIYAQIPPSGYPDLVTDVKIHNITKNIIAFRDKDGYLVTVKAINDSPSVTDKVIDKPLLNGKIFKVRSADNIKFLDNTLVTFISRGEYVYCKLIETPSTQFNVRKFSDTSFETTFNKMNSFSLLLDGIHTVTFDHVELTNTSNGREAFNFDRYSEKLRLMYYSYNSGNKVKPASNNENWIVKRDGDKVKIVKNAKNIFTIDLTSNKSKTYLKQIEGTGEFYPVLEVTLKTAAQTTVYVFKLTKLNAVPKPEKKESTKEEQPKVKATTSNLLERLLTKTKVVELSIHSILSKAVTSDIANNLPKYRVAYSSTPSRVKVSDVVVILGNLVVLESGKFYQIEIDKEKSTESKIIGSVAGRDVHLRPLTRKVDLLKEIEDTARVFFGDRVAAINDNKTLSDLQIRLKELFGKHGVYADTAPTDSSLLPLTSDDKWYLTQSLYKNVPILVMQSNIASLNGVKLSLKFNNFEDDLDKHELVFTYSHPDTKVKYSLPLSVKNIFMQDNVYKYVGDRYNFDFVLASTF